MNPKRVGPDGAGARRQQDQSGAIRVSELGGYRLIATLGKGNTAKVYLALKRGPAGFTKLVVVKALRRDLVNSLEHIEMFLDEARLSARLNHPNLAQTFEVGEEDGRYFIEMEYLAGQTLRSVYRRVARGSFPVALQLRILSEVARGLHYAHELEGFDGEPLQIVHRDVTPHNIMLTYDGHVKLLDFGIAKAEGNDHLTEMGMLKGKADYIAPEQVRGGPVDRRADIFALGAMAYEAVTGRSFSGGSKVPMVTRLHRRISGAEPPVREVNPNVPELLATLIDSATAVDPDDRVPTAEAFADRIDAFLERTQAHVGPPVLSKLLEGPFETDRRRLGQLVEAQAHSARNAGRDLARHTSMLPIMRAGDTPTGLDVRLPSSISQVPAPPSQSATRPTSKSPSSRATIPSPSPPTLSSGLDTGVQPLPSQRPSTPPPAPRRNLTQMLSTTLAVAALVAAGALWLQRGLPLAGDSAPQPQAAAPAAQAPSEPAAGTATPGAGAPESEAPVAEQAEQAQAAPPSPEMVRIRIQVIPAHAQVTLDGARLETPADLALEKSERTHVLWANAPGFRAIRRQLSQSEDTNLVLRLARKPSRRPARRAAPSAPKAAAERPAEASRDADDDEVTAVAVDEPQPEPEPAAETAVEPGESIATPEPAPSLIDVDNPYR